MIGLRVMVTTVGGLTSPDILRALKMNGERDIEIVGVDPFEYVPGRAFVDHFHTVPSSGTSEVEFVSAIQTLVEKYRIDVVVPCGNEDNLALSKYRREISAAILAGEYGDLAVAYDKGAVYESVHKHAPDIAPMYEIVNSAGPLMRAMERMGYPDRKVVIKPRHGRGGRGVHIVSNEFDFNSFFLSKPSAEIPIETVIRVLEGKDDFSDLIVMEHLGEPVHSIYSLCHGGRNIFTMTHIREWGTASQTYRGLVYYDEEMEKMASKVIGAMRLTYTCNMELGVSPDGRLVLFDLNPRLAASSATDCALGVNFPYLALKLLLGEDVSVDPTPFRSKSRFTRYFDHFWMK
jgi:carbamoylphosphate synthase large subunit